MRLLTRWNAPLIVSGAFALGASASAQNADYRSDAEQLLRLIDTQYAYLERFEGSNPARGANGVDPSQVNSREMLLDFAECSLKALQDHHAILNVSSPRSYGLTPSYNDLWIEHKDGQFLVSDVRHGSPAQSVGIAPGWRLVSVSIEEEPIENAVAALCGGPFETDDAKGFAARTLVAGRQGDVDRYLSFRDHNERLRRFALTSLYSVQVPERPLITVRDHDGVRHLRFNDSLGSDRLIDAIDNALSGPRPSAIIVDLRDTPSGGNTLNARALMGRFVDQARPYQRHALPQIERDSGVSRQWVEEVAPRGESLSGIPMVVLAGRWTGSMGEGLVLGLDAVADAHTLAAPMAGLLGAVYDYRLEHSGWVVKLPSETLYHIDGTAREVYRADTVLESADMLGSNGEDLALNQALAILTSDTP